MCGGSDIPLAIQAGGKVDYFVSGIGTGGTVTGAGKYLYEMNPDIKIVAVEPTESRVCQGATHSPHTVLGIGAGVPAHFIESLEPGKPMEPGPRGHISEFGHASSDEAVDWAKRLAQKEGIMVGPSSGAAMKVPAPAKG